MKNLVTFLVCLLLPLTSFAAVTYPINGGTGSTTLYGILIGNGKSPINSLTIGTNLTLTGTTLNASGGNGVGTSTNPFMATYYIATSTLVASSFPLASTTAVSATSLCLITCITSFLNVSDPFTHPFPNYSATTSAMMVGTSTPNNAQFTIGSSTAPQLSLVDNLTSNNAWTVRAISNSLYFATSTASATSSSAAIAISPNGLVTFANPVLLPNGTPAAPALAFTSQSSTGFYFPAANIISISTAGSQQFNFDGSRLYAANGNGPWISNASSISVTAPVFIPNRGDTTTGFSSGITGTVNTIIRGTEMARWTQTGQGIGSTTPWGVLSVMASTTAGLNPLFVVATSTTNKDIAFMVTNGGHIIASSTNPVLSSCGTGPTMKGDDHHGRVTPGAAASGCTVTFQIAYSNVPVCMVTPETGSVVNTFTFLPSATALTVTETGLTIFDYICEGVQGPN